MDILSTITYNEIQSHTITHNYIQLHTITYNYVFYNYMTKPQVIVQQRNEINTQTKPKKVAGTDAVVHHESKRQCSCNELTE